MQLLLHHQAGHFLLGPDTVYLRVLHASTTTGKAVSCPQLLYVLSILHILNIQSLLP
jgi:hypothetical protein